MKMIVVLGMIFMMSYQPIMMVFSIIVLTLFCSMYMYMYMGSFWYSYLMLLVMLSGVLIIFTYMVSLTPDERFEEMMIIYGWIILILMMNFAFNNGMMLDEYVGMMLWENIVFYLNCFLMMFLLSMMIMVVWVTVLDKKPMRIYWSAWLKG